MRKLFQRWPLIIIFLLSATPILWFLGKGAVLINGIDTNFPLNPEIWLARRFFVWTNTVNAGGDFSSSTSGIFFHLIQFLPFKMGVGLQNAEILSLVFWFLMIVTGSFYLARIIFPKKASIQLLFVILYSYNTFLFNTWENVKVSNLSLVAALPFAIAVLAQLRKREIDRVTAAFYSVIIGILFSGSGINPSYFLCLILALFLFFIAELVIDRNIKSFLISLKNFSTIAFFITAVNLFWMLPTGNFILRNISSTGSIDKLGLTNWLDSLSENTSLLNVLRLQGAWDWYAIDSITHLPIYIPYALNYFYHPIFILFSFILPGLALISYTVISKKKLDWYIAFGLMILIGVFLGTGTHLPTGSVYRFLVDHVAFFSIFRSPWYIFTPLVTISYAGLIGLLFFSLDEVIQSNKIKFGKLILLSTIAIIAIGNLFYTYPLVTGKIFRPGRQDGFFIKFPDYVFQAEKWLVQAGDGRIISYPDDEIENFNWGYRGIESILGLLSDKELLFAPLNSPDAPVARLIKEYYRNLKLGQIDASYNLASKLNIKYIFNKKDERSLAPELSVKVRTNLDQIFGSWEFYKLPQSSFVPKISATAQIYLSDAYKKVDFVLATTPKNTALVDKKDKIVNQISNIVGTSGEVILGRSSQVTEFINFQLAPSILSNRLTNRDFSKVTYNFEVTKSGFYEPILEKYKVEDFGIDITKPIEVDIDGKITTLDPIENTSDSLIKFKQIKLDSGSHSLTLKLSNKNLIYGGTFNDGYVFKEGGYGTGRAQYSIENNGSSKYLSILNHNKADSQAVFNINGFDPYGAYYMEFSYKQIYGNNGTAIVYQSNGDVLLKASTERLPNYPEWNIFSFYYQPVASSSKAELALSAPYTPDPLGTKILYGDVKAYKVFTNNLVLVMDNGTNEFNNPQVNFSKESPVSYSGNVSNGGKDHIIVFAENYSPQWKLALFKEDGSKISVNPLHFTANAYANGWYIDVPESNYKFKIYYDPQNIFLIGSGISLLTILLTALYFFNHRFRSKHV
ncbi:MAG: hypothetical protein Q7R49_04335 [Candidatus Daviesbacteria bacterium]|nr:hypothetical protein [Candidatus Daviesbacteria bacterium]